MPQVGFNRLSQPRNRLREIAGQTRVPITGGAPQPPPQPQPSGLEAMLMELLSQPESELKPPSPIPLPAPRKQPQGFWETMAQEFLPRVAESTLNMEGSIDKRRATEDADAMARYEAEKKAQQQEFDNTLGVANYKRLGQANKISAMSQLAGRDTTAERPQVLTPGAGLFGPSGQRLAEQPARPDTNFAPFDLFLKQYPEGTVEQWLAMNDQTSMGGFEQQAFVEAAKNNPSLTREQFHTRWGEAGREDFTAATRSMLERAPTVSFFVDKIQKEIANMERGLGPVASRWREFNAGRVGLDDPAFTQLRTNLGLMKTMLMQMHIGARGGEYIMQHFDNLFKNLSPVNLSAALEETKQYAQYLMQRGSNPGVPGVTPPPSTEEPVPIPTRPRQ